MLFHIAASLAYLRPQEAETVLHSARDLITETGRTSDLLELERPTLSADVMREICRQLAPYQVDEKPITGQTVIYQELSIDSLAVMDIIMELEDRFEVAIPINVVAEIRTVEELAGAILRARG